MILQKDDSNSCWGKLHARRYKGTPRPLHIRTALTYYTTTHQLRNKPSVHSPSSQLLIIMSIPARQGQSQSDELPLPPSWWPPTGYTREEALWKYRTDMEGAHRVQVRVRAIINSYRAPLGTPGPIPDMEVSDVLDCCNKSVAVYVPLLTGEYPNERALHPLVHNYLYHRWFRPYQSEIELQRFICKTITPTNLPHEPSPSEATINNFASLNGATCAHVKERHGIYDELVSAGQRIHELRFYGDHRLYMLQPLFQALLIIVCVRSYTFREDSTNIGQFPVLLVRTGVEQGLSAPITFQGLAGAGGNSDSAYYIKTALETAVDFVMALEAREAAVFGLQPDPKAAFESWKESLICGMGLYEEDLGDEPVIGPSSKFVDVNKYSTWGGHGRCQDRAAKKYEESLLRWQRDEMKGDLD